jgi:hypothetical protein
MCASRELWLRPVATGFFRRASLVANPSSAVIMLPQSATDATEEAGPSVCVYHPAPITRRRDPGQSRSAELAAGSQGSSLDVGQVSPDTPWSRSSPQDAAQSQGQRGSLRDKYITDWSKRIASFAARSPLGGLSLPDLHTVSRGVLSCEIFPSEIMYSFSWKMDRDHRVILDLK